MCNKQWERSSNNQVSWGKGKKRWKVGGRWLFIFQGSALTINISYPEGME